MNEIVMEHTPHTKLGWIDLALVAMVTIWGVNAVVVKLAYLQFQPVAFMTLRFIIPPIVFALILCLTDRRFVFSRRDWIMLTLAGLVGTTIYQPCFLFGLQLSDVSDAALIIATTPAFVAILNRLLGREQLAPRGWLGIVIAFVGVAFSLSGNRSFGFSPDMWLGYVLLFFSDLFWASYVVLIAPLMQRHPPLRVTALSIILGAIPLVLFNLPSLAAQDWNAVNVGGWSSVLFSSVLAVVATTVIWNLSVQKIGGARTAIYMNLTPVIAMFTAVLLLSKEITLAKIIGTAIILFGVNLVRTAKLAMQTKPVTKSVN
jgi:drug/metabolite transporter (DMT)-like permease